MPTFHFILLKNTCYVINNNFQSNFISFYYNFNQSVLNLNEINAIRKAKLDERNTRRKSSSFEKSFCRNWNWMIISISVELLCYSFKIVSIIRMCISSKAQRMTEHGHSLMLSHMRLTLNLCIGTQWNWLIFYYWPVNRTLLLSLIIKRLWQFALFV